MVNVLVVPVQPNDDLGVTTSGRDGSVSCVLGCKCRDVARSAVGTQTNRCAIGGRPCAGGDVDVATCERYRGCAACANRLVRGLRENRFWMYS